jgi:hypothetical protein
MGNVEPAIYVGGEAGVHNADHEKSRQRLAKSRSYKDLSTICVIPTRGMIPARVVESWWGMMTPMNQKFTRVIIRGMEVGDAYNAAIQLILDNPELSTWKYLLTLEEDNMPSPDALLKLYENIEDWDALGGLYWTKGLEGQPMIYGDPKAMLNFIPQAPVVEGVQECNGLGMGFTLFKLDLFRQIEAPWFVTEQTYDMAGVRQYTQDLYFFERARKAGKRVACDTRVKVGHYDVNEDIVW